MLAAVPTRACCPPSSLSGLQQLMVGGLVLLPADMHVHAWLPELWAVCWAMRRGTQCMA